MQATATTELGTAELAADLYALFVHLNKSCSADLFAAMSELELSITQLKLLHQLELAGKELTVKEAAESVLLSVAAVSRTVDDLVRRGIVERHEDTEDRRMKRVGLTEAGRRAIRMVSEARLAGLEQFARSLSDEERRALAPALEALMRRSDMASCRPDRSKAR
ncbi:MAG TPA: MarR family transcriptional regulator [Solirubrobacteraceae bacterium]|nr:MarR family transcriptional regulator [Solirubrobacteraceae bacterium]